MKKRSTSIEFRKSGPKTSANALRGYPIYFPEDIQRFLIKNNGGEPLNKFFQFFAEDDREQILCLDYFHGATFPKPDDYSARRYDIVNAILQYRDYLPRWSIPIGRINEDCFLLKFYGGPYDGKICYFIWIHDDFHGDNDPNDGDGLYVLNDSLSEFLERLSSYNAFRVVRSCALTDEKLKPAALAKKLKDLGCSRIGGKADSLQSWNWDHFDDLTTVTSEVYVRYNDSKKQPPMEGLTLPRLAGYSGETTVLHFVYSRHCEPIAISLIQKVFGGSIEFSDEIG